jgi:hypothetical protein
VGEPHARQGKWKVEVMGRGEPPPSRSLSYVDVACLLLFVFDLSVLPGASPAAGAHKVSHGPQWLHEIDSTVHDAELIALLKS